MSIDGRVRDVYERYPYPPAALRKKPTWRLPAVEWIAALRESREEFAPKRILVAGCGVGTEAAMIAKQFAGADVVGVDFSERSIATARKLLPAKLRDRVRFVVGDLTAENLASKTGTGFDLVTCHGVLSYIPDVRAVLRNFTRLLSPDGVLVLGVNGATHPSVRFRQALPKFGFAPELFSESRKVRDTLRVFDCIVEYPRLPMADRAAGYLAGDIFGPLNHALPLAGWSALIDGAGLHILGTYHAYFATRVLFNHDLHLHVMPRSRRDMSELADVLQPASFHQIVVSRRAPESVPWTDAKALMDWRPALTSLFTWAWPHGGRDPHRLRSVAMKSRTTNTKVELNVPQWEVDALRLADGSHSLRELLANVRPRVAPKAAAEAMYLLYLMAAANMLPPEEP